MSEKKVNYFTSGVCYTSGTNIVIRRFNVITEQTYFGDPDPADVMHSVIDMQTRSCKQAGHAEVYVHIETMNKV